MKSIINLKQATLLAIFTICFGNEGVASSAEKGLVQVAGDVIEVPDELAEQVIAADEGKRRSLLTSFINLSEMFTGTSTGWNRDRSDSYEREIYHPQSYNSYDSRDYYRGSRGHNRQRHKSHHSYERIDESVPLVGIPYRTDPNTSGGRRISKDIQEAQELDRVEK